MSDNFLKELLEGIREDVRELRIGLSVQNTAMSTLETKVNELHNILGTQKKKAYSLSLAQHLRVVQLHREH